MRGLDATLMRAMCARPYRWKMAEVFAHCDRRDSNLRKHKPCPACGDAQVQIMNAHVPLAQSFFKCRICSTRFVLEAE